MLCYPIRYDDDVSDVCIRYQVPRAVVFGVIHTESHFRPSAVSRVGAMGLMQLMPATFSSIAVKLALHLDTASAFDPKVNIQCGTYLLSCLFRKYRNWETVFAAYNAGETAVDQWLLDPRYADNGRLFHIPYGETRQYVRRVMQAIEIYEKHL